STDRGDEGDFATGDQSVVPVCEGAVDGHAQTIGVQDESVACAQDLVERTQITIVAVDDFRGGAGCITQAGEIQHRAPPHCAPPKSRLPPRFAKTFAGPITMRWDSALHMS